MAIFLEQSWPVLAIGITALIVTLAIWVQMQRGILLVAAAAILALTVGGVALERKVVTDFEVLQTSLQQIAEDLASNDIDLIAQHISTKSPQLRNDAARILRQGTIKRVSVKNNLEAEFSQEDPPQRVEASFNAVATVTAKGDPTAMYTVPQFFTVVFERENGQWKVVSYTNSDPRDGIRH
ncbi:MAG: hypothetical protein KDA87_26440 [Planctomycetales bacterium]|nr:hypothetical protein [Planctomycetales bacterium]